jgi:hypothetical protein
LTSLYAVIKGVEVLRANFRRERIRIAFNPLSCRFDVADAAILKDKAFIPKIGSHRCSIERMGHSIDNC